MDVCEENNSTLMDIKNGLASISEIVSEIQEYLNKYYEKSF